MKPAHTISLSCVITFGTVSAYERFSCTGVVQYGVEVTWRICFLPVLYDIGKEGGIKWAITRDRLYATKRYW